MVKRIANEGMPTFKRPDSRGDLYVKFDVEFPADNFAASGELDKLEALLPKRKQETTKHEIIDECALMPGDLNAYGASGQSRNAYDEDEDYEDDDDQPGVRCAQQ
jgi:DnaJ family protein A protein 2